MSSRPQVESLAKQIELLERRCDYLMKRGDTSTSERARSYDLAEIAALRKVIEIAIWYALDGRRAAGEFGRDTPVGLCFELLGLDPRDERAVRNLQDRVANFLEGID